MSDQISEQLGKVFCDEVIQSFGFLQTECGFQTPNIRYEWAGMSSDFSTVRYESQDAFLQVFYAHMEAEISIQIGLLSSVEFKRGFDLGEVLSFVASDVQIPCSMTKARTTDRIKLIITNLADITTANLMQVLSNPKLFLPKWQVIRQSENRKQELNDYLESKHKEANDAWSLKNYAKVVQLYESIIDHLTPVENKRLQYARKRSS